MVILTGQDRADVVIDAWLALAALAAPSSPGSPGSPREVRLMLVAGVDSSTQSTKVVLCRAEDGAVVGQAAAPHPDGTECDPAYWWEALGNAGRDLLEQASAVGVAAQQPGMIALDE